MKLNCKSYVFVNPVESMQATLSASELNYIVPYAYGMPIRVWDRENAHTRTGYPIRVWVVPYAYGLSHTRMGQNKRTGCNIIMHVFSSIINDGSLSQETKPCISLACQTVCVGAVNKPSGHCCTHSGTTAGMLAEPIRSLRALCDETTTNNSNS